MTIFNTGLSHFKKSKVVPIFYCINDAYAPYAAASINSIIKHIDKDRYYRIIILHDGLSLKNRTRLRNLVTHHVAMQFTKVTNNLHLRMIIRYCSTKRGDGSFFSSAVYYYRFFIPSLFLHYDKGVYIDSDTILLDDIAKLYDTDLEDNVMAARPDPKIANIPEFNAYAKNYLKLSPEHYFNSGVLVMNLKGLRRLHYLQTLVDLIDKYDADLIAPDQDYMNVILYDKVKPLSPLWNMEAGADIPKDTHLIHYNLFNKPWLYKNVHGEKYFWNAARGTGFYGDLKRQQQNFTKEEQDKDHAKVDALIQKGVDLSRQESPLLDHCKNLK